MRTVKLTLPEQYRIICVSDIHAHCDDFKALLDKCGYRPESDYLFILGDILEKGRQNIETLRFVKKLCENPKCICLQGNNDTMCERMAFRDTKEKFLSRLKFRPDNTYMDMAKSIGITDFDIDFDDKRVLVNNAFSDELQFIRDLPLAIDTEDYLFVHAGIEDRTDWENSEERIIQSTPWFLRSRHPLSKYVVVGHFPCFNFRRANNTNRPIIDLDQRMIDIDGGCEVKWAGQLNALIIKKNGKDYHYSDVFLPLVPSRRVKSDFISDTDYKYCDVDNSDLEIVGEQGEFYRVLNRYDGSEGMIPKRCTGEWDGRLHGWINLDCFLSVKKDEQFYVYGEIGDYYFGIAQNGQVGLVPKEHIE